MIVSFYYFLDLQLNFAGFEVGRKRSSVAPLRKSKPFYTLVGGESQTRGRRGAGLS
jgi:hypothetical protein